MNRIFLFILSVIFLTAIQENSARAEETLQKHLTASEMAENCEGLVGKDLSFGSGVCLGYFISVQNYLGTKFTDENVPIFRICLPQGSNVRQLIKVFLKYANDHPERHHEDVHIVTMDALKKSFSCK